MSPFASPGYGINQFEDEGQRRAEWSIRDAKGKQDLFYKVKLHSEPEAQLQAEDPPEAVKATLLPEPYQTAAESLVKEVHTRSADARSFTGTLLKAFNAIEPSQNTNMILDLIDSGENRTQVLINLLNHAEIPARMVRGLNPGRRSSSSAHCGNAGNL